MGAAIIGGAGAAALVAAIAFWLRWEQKRPRKYPDIYNHLPNEKGQYPDHEGFFE